MKKTLFTLMIPAMLLACAGKPKTNTEMDTKTTTPAAVADVKDKSFDELFRQVDSLEIRKYLAELMVGQDHTVITAGTEARYNSMPTSWEVLGRYFRQPMTFCQLGSNRYTLELMEQEKSYTMSFFPEQYNGDVFAFGRGSGRDSDKMKETKLTHVTTPSGNITYKEATTVIECELFQVTATNPNDFYTEEGRKFIEDGAKDSNGKGCHKLVFGNITNVWVRK